MNRRLLTLLTLIGLPALPAIAQPVIGGGTCSSSTLTGTYELLLSGRHFATTAAATQIFEGAGTATFDGLSKVSFSLMINTVATKQSFGVAATYSGTYSLQANCIGAISITTGDTATYTLEAYNQAGGAVTASGFAITGSDASYAFNGTGTMEPATCPTTIAGAHEFTGTGSGLSGATPTTTLDVAGMLNFTASTTTPTTGTVAATWTQASNLTVSQVTATGSYTASAGCLASMTLTDTANNAYTFNLSFDSASPSFAFVATSPTEIFDGTASGEQATEVTSCSTASLNGTFYMLLAGRLAPAGVPTKLQLSDGAVKLDGLGHVTITLTADTVNGSQLFGAPLTYSGTYAVQSTCLGTVNITSGDTANFNMVVYNFDTTTLLAKSFVMVGSDATYAYNGSGGIAPSACLVATISGTMPFSGTGNSLSGSTLTGIADLEGLLTFDGQGNVTASWTQVTNAASTNFSATGTYSVTGACLGTLSLTDGSGNSYSGVLTVESPDTNGYPNDVEIVLSSPQLLFSGAGRQAFVNPGESLINNSGGGEAASPAGSVFAIYGSDLAAKSGQPTTVPLPTLFDSGSISINSVLAPLFYVSPGQMDGQMPWEVQPGLATVFVKNNGVSSNAVAVIIPTVAPELDIYENNLAVATFTDYTDVTSADPALIGDTVVLWFTGGGPVNASGKLVTGSGAPAGLSPVTGAYTITVGGVEATSISYVGLTPGSIGLYQASFVVPTGTPAGSQQVVLTISGVTTKVTGQALATMSIK